MKIINSFIDYIKLMFSKLRRQRIVMLDTSGSAIYNEENIRKDIAENIRIGDRVIMFDHRVYDQGMMRDRFDITTMRITGGGGSAIIPAIEAAIAINAKAKMICISDGYVYDGPIEQAFIKHDLKVNHIMATIA